jgi:hypothetical protein
MNFIITEFVEQLLVGARALGGGFEEKYRSDVV